jgi:hypothetical protein
MRLLPLLLLLGVSSLQADTIKNFMEIANNISTMEMKADAQAQAWARSARNVLNVTCESIAETMLQANQTATAQGRPLFCLPSGTKLDANLLNTLIQETYKTISSQASDKDGMTVSQVAWMGVNKQYACEQKQGDLRGMMHVEG